MDMTPQRWDQTSRYLQDVFGREDQQLATIMSAEENPETCVNKMIADANRRGGLDNITAIVIRVDDVEAQNTGEMPAAKSA